MMKTYQKPHVEYISQPHEDILTLSIVENGDGLSILFPEL